MSEYISIKDFANRAGVSPQAIYQRLDKDLKDFFKEVEGKKSLNTKGLELFSFKAVEQVVDKQIDKQLTSALNETLKVLTAQIEAKDKQLEFKDRQLEVKDIQISELNERLKEAQELNKNNQILLGAEQSRTNPALLIGDSKPSSQDDDTPIKKKIWQFWKK